VRVDLHIHTASSADSFTTLRDVVRFVTRRKLDAVAITDHNTIAAALAMRQETAFQVIVGEEIATAQGEIIGLFLREEIPAGLSPQETVARIRAQGGVVYLPHPFDRARSSTLTPAALADILPQTDVVEVLNARVTFPLINRLAEELAQEHHLRRGAGSDAHQRSEIGRAFVEMPPFHDAPSFMLALAQGQVRGRVSSPLVHVGSTYARLAKEVLAIAPK
jgi:hypothetical protein